MRTRILLLILTLLLVLPQVYAESPSGSAELNVLFEVLPRGEIGEIHVAGTQIRRVRVAFLDHQYVLLPDAEGQFLGWVPVPIDAKTGSYRLSILVQYADGTEQYMARDIRVAADGFDQSNLALGGSLIDLLDPEILLDEMTVLDGYLNVLSEGDEWLQTGLEMPFQTPISAGFGTYRLFNGEVWQRHTGVDFPAPVGTSVKVAAAGHVVFVGELPIRGNYVLVDHGSGLFTGYAHLSATYVQAGEVVEQGSLIGEVGNTGRSLGYHLHWEVALGGVWVHPIKMANLLAQ